MKNAEYVVSKVMPVGLMMKIIGNKYDTTCFYEDNGDDCVPVHYSNEEILWHLFNHEKCYITVWKYGNKEEVSVHFLAD